MTVMEVIFCCIVDCFVGPIQANAVSIQTSNMITFGCNCFVCQKCDPYRVLRRLASTYNFF